MNTFFLHVDAKKANHAGSKAVEDCEIILEKNGFKKIKAYSCFSNLKIVRQIVKGLQLIRLYRLPKKSKVVIQHPLYMNNRYLRDLGKLKKKRNLKYIFIIHDLESIRNLFGDKEKYQEKDNLMFSLADIVIAHNSKMIDAIEKTFDFPKEKMIALEVFDYLLSNRVDLSLNTKDKNLGVMVVGNLNPEKCGYLYSPNCKQLINSFNLYGPQFDAMKLKDARYFGQFPPEIVVEQLKGSFGLVWDGNSPDTCEGKIGKYLMINNPHKVSMYLAAGFPVIIWRQAALAEFVKKYSIGILIDSLWEIPDKIKEISDEDYDKILDNVSYISKKITTGFYLKFAIDSALNKIE